MNAPLRKLGFGALIGGGAAVLTALFVAALLIGPLIFWLAWNVLDFGPSVGLPELGFWAIVLATLFLTVGWFGKTVITAIVFMVDPAWFSGAALMSWPQPTFKNFIAVLLLAVLATRPHAHAHTKQSAKQKQPAPPAGGAGSDVWQQVKTEIQSAIATQSKHGRPGSTV